MRFPAPLSALASCLGLVCINQFANAQGPAAPPAVRCSASPTSINAGDAVSLNAAVASPTGQPVNFSFTSSAGALNTNGNVGTLATNGVSAGPIQLTCRATDNSGQSSSATTTVWVNNTPGEQALSAFTFPDSVGVNIHLHSGNTPYWYNFPSLFRSMTDLGVHHYRNGIDAYATPYEMLNAEILGIAGIKSNWLIASDCLANCVNHIDAVAHHSIDSYEGPNEDDADSVYLPNWMSGLSNTVHSNPRTANMPIYAPTPLNVSKTVAEGSLSPFVDAGNMHDYYGTRFPETPPYGGTVAGCPYYGDLRFNICIANVMAPYRPVISSETGYISGGLSDVVIGKYTTRLLLNHLSAGVMRTYLYEFLDEPGALPNGLVHTDFSPKPAYSGVRSLISFFGDSTFTAPGKFEYSLTGQTNNVHHVLFQKSDGTYMLALWLGVESGHPVPPNYDYNIPAQTVSVATRTPVGTVGISSLDDNGNLYQITPVTDGTTTAVPVTDRVTIVTFAPASSTVGTFAPAAATRTTALDPGAWYTLTAGVSNLCVDIANGNTANLSPILQWNCAQNNYNQQWQFQPTDNGYYRIVNRAAPSQAFDVYDLATANNSLINVFSYWGGSNQQWMPVALGNGFYKFVGRGSNRCFATPPQYGAQLLVYDCDNSAGETFHLTQQP